MPLRNSRIIMPTGAMGRTPRIVVRDRPRYHVKKRGVVGVKLDGWMRWEMVNRAGRVTRGGEQHNLFLDAALDRMALNGGLWYGPGFGGTQFLDRAVVGTSSVEPDVSDTALGSFLAASSIGYTSYAEEEPIGAADGVVRLSKGEEFDFDEGNGNLTEWGIETGAVSSTRYLITRELFRDEVGDPVTITKTSDEKLRITYYLDVAYGPTVPEAVSFDLTGVGNVSGVAGVTRGSSGVAYHAALAAVIRGDLPTWASSGPYAWACPSDWTPSFATRPSISSYTTRFSELSSDAYVPGSYERTVSFSAGTDKLNYQHYGYGVLRKGTSSAEGGWAFRFDNADRLTKDDLHLLDMDLMKITWARTGS